MTRTSRVLVLAGTISFLCTGWASAQVKKSIAVAPIQWQAAATIGGLSGEALTAQLISELNNSGKYRVVERENLEGILKEQDMATAGRTRKGSGAKTGDIEGAQLLIKAVITDAEEKGSQGGGVGIGGISVGGGETEYLLTMDMRIYDATTSLIMKTVTVSAKQKKGAVNAGVGIGGVSVGGQKSGGDTTGAVVRDLIVKALGQINEQSEAQGWKTKVQAVKEGKIIILGGTRDGLKDGMKFEVFKLGEPLVDEKTGEVLDEGEETKIGEIELTEVKDKVAYAKAVSGEGFEKDNVAKLIANKTDQPKEEGKGK